MSARGQKIFKSIIVVVFIGVFAFVNLVPNMSLYKIECLHDYTHEYTSSVNEWFKENSGAKKTMMILGGIFSDIITLMTLGYWTIKVKTWRLPIALVLVYVAKALTSLLFKYRYPDGYLWENPGFYSLTTPYGASNDMHFTLHVALLYVIFQELRTLELHWLAPTIAFVIFLYQAAVALTTRGAYIIDLFAAFIFGHYFFVVAEQLSYYIDVGIFGLTFQERFPNFQTNCGKCKHPINQWTKNNVEDVQRAMDNQRRH